MESPLVPAEEPAAEPSRPTTTGPIREYTTAQCISAIGSWMQRTAMGWLAWDLTHSVFWVGAVALMDFLSVLWVAPLAGPMADRRSPYRVFMTTQVLLLINAMAMCLLDLAGFLHISILLGFALISATLNGFNNPVRMTTINYLAPQGRISQAIAMNSIGISVARIAGPALAGVLLVGGGAAAVFAINSLSFLAMIFVLRRLRVLIDHRPQSHHRPFLSDIAGGYAYIARTPQISLLILVGLTFAVLARPFGELLPAFAGDIFKGGPQTLSALMTTQGLGSMAGALFMMRRHSEKPLEPLMFGAGLGLTVFLLVFCATADLRIALPAMFAIGICHVLCNISLQSLMQQHADPALRGRVLSIHSLIFGTGPSLGAFLIGSAAPLAGLQPLVAGAAFLAGGLMLLLSRRRIAR
jgi:MFS family permease